MMRLYLPLEGITADSLWFGIKYLVGIIFRHHKWVFCFHRLSLFGTVLFQSIVLSYLVPICFISVEQTISRPESGRRRFESQQTHELLYSFENISPMR
jgi:hypothetical protein